MIFLFLFKKHFCLHRIFCGVRGLQMVRRLQPALLIGAFEFVFPKSASHVFKFNMCHMS